jgi:hypothetical protein
MAASAKSGSNGSLPRLPLLKWQAKLQVISTMLGIRNSRWGKKKKKAGRQAKRRRL